MSIRREAKPRCSVLARRGRGVTRYSGGWFPGNFVAGAREGGEAGLLPRSSAKSGWTLVFHCFNCFVPGLGLQR